MPDRLRSAAAAILFAAAAVGAAPPASVSAAGYKVAIIVGPTGAQTDSYRQYADEVRAAAEAAGATVVTVYSPNATWVNVKAAVNGANIIVWMGHGNGWPSPYTSPPNSTATAKATDRVNGWGLNRTSLNGDDDNWSTTMVYCGERALLGTLTTSDDTARRTYCGGTANDGITPAPGFVMIYAHACYTPGAGEGFDVNVAEPIALARVAGYSAPVLNLGASAYYATDNGDEADLVDRLLRNPVMSFGAAFRAGWGYAPGAIRTLAHPNVPGASVWLQRTVHGSDNDYWYAFAGDSHQSLSGVREVVTPTEVARFAGSNRYGTAAAISAASFNPGVPVAYVATGTGFPDALAAGAAAAHGGGPVLLVTATSVPGETATELDRLNPQRIVVVGGSAAVSDAVAADLESYTTGSVTRVAGTTRYETAAQISASAFAPGVNVAYVATGANFPDALAGVPAAGAHDGPVLLVAPTGIPQPVRVELSRLRPMRIVILGSTGAVSAAIASQLAGIATSGQVARLAGASRYDTAAAIAAGSFASATTVFLATGLNFPDALGGGPVAGILPGPLLLVTEASIPPSAAHELSRLRPTRIVVLGGTAVVSDAVVGQARAILGG